jgi:hypothetical protein
MKIKSIVPGGLSLVLNPDQLKNNSALKLHSNFHKFGTDRLRCSCIINEDACARARAHIHTFRYIKVDEIKLKIKQ